MEPNQYNITAKVWLYGGPDPWHFVTISKKESEEIKNIFGDLARGWGSLPVTVTVGGTTWNTSIFPDKRSGSYMLPLKAEVRKKEAIKANDDIALLLRINV